MDLQLLNWKNISDLTQTSTFTILSDFCYRFFSVRIRFFAFSKTSVAVSVSDGCMNNLLCGQLVHE